MKVLLTGATGNVGSHTLPELLRQGHQVRCLVLNAKDRALRGAEVVRGDVRDPGAVARACAGVDAVVHLAAVIPPTSDEKPGYARAVNVDGTANVIAACRAQAVPPRLLYTSTLDVHGNTLAKPPPRRVDDPLVATNGYTEDKIQCEALVRGSGLEWCIFRLADVPVLGLRDPHPIMFEIGLDNRIEALHADDAGLALANALHTPEVWRRILFVGGGPSCQLTYREYLSRILGAMGLDPLPDKAFSDAEYATDWLDTEESQRLLCYQRYTFDDIAAAVSAALGWRRRLVGLAGPLARASLLRMSPYYRSRR
ncbi:MAG TPA: NAD(P)-dependent oxidoreductase [Rugosimonospora sp.]|nr:NAD(P)-dependent oxidoreductase [Rugosimonospora sp.]